MDRLVYTLMYYAGGSKKNLQDLFQDVIQDLQNMPHSDPHYSDTLWLMNAIRPFVPSHGLMNVQDIIKLKYK